MATGVEETVRGARETRVALDAHGGRRTRLVMAGTLVRRFLAASVLAGCAVSPSPAGLAATSPAAPVQRANPASQDCIAKGGTLSIVKNGSGGEYGVCGFADNRQCEEWARFRGECPVGGIRVTGYVTPAARYCAITGGQYTVTGQSNTPTEQGACSFPGGKRCEAGAYYDGRCGR